ncbi:hypothetical protein PG988_007048 [Apiospora saccharicola]
MAFNNDRRHPNSSPPPATTPWTPSRRSSASDWRSTASPNNATSFSISPTGTPPFPAGVFIPPPASLTAAATNFSNATTTTTGAVPSPPHVQFGYPRPRCGGSQTSLNATPFTAAAAHGPQVALTATQASYLVCPWWWTYSRCGQRGCNFSHALGANLKQQPLICPYWLRSPGTTGAGCNKAEGTCQFAHYHCEHGQKAPVPKPK